MAASAKETPGRTVLSAQGVCKDYVDGDRRLTVLTDVGLDVKSGEFVAIVGASGSGKSTLLHLLGALDRPTEGVVRLEEDDYSRLSDRDLDRIRSTRIGFVFQFHHLLPEFTALENVMMPGMIARAAPAGMVGRAAQLLGDVGLSERLDHRPSKLSGGEQQRVAIARALLNDPLLVLADEPTGNLDRATSGEVLTFLLSMTVERGKSLVMVTHEPEIAARAHRRLHLEGGRLAG